MRMWWNTYHARLCLSDMLKQFHWWICYSKLHKFWNFWVVSVFLQYSTSMHVLQFFSLLKIIKKYLVHTSHLLHHLISVYRLVQEPMLLWKDTHRTGCHFNFHSLFNFASITSFTIINITNVFMKTDIILFNSQAAKVLQG